MYTKQIDSILSNMQELERSLRVSVKIPSDEVDRLIVERLIKIRNSDVNKNRDMSHIDKTIRFFLSEDEFQKYVIDKVALEY